jgi:glycine dehydrogenase
MIAIREEIREVERGRWSVDKSPLRNAPHTLADLVAAEWPFAYDRHTAVLPAGEPAFGKYWPPVARVDNVYGDRNLVCTCPPLEAYRDEAA